MKAAGYNILLEFISKEYTGDPENHTIKGKIISIGSLVDGGFMQYLGKIGYIKEYGSDVISPIIYSVHHRELLAIE